MRLSPPTASALEPEWRAGLGRPASLGLRVEGLKVERLRVEGFRVEGPPEPRNVP